MRRTCSIPSGAALLLLLAAGALAAPAAGEVVGDSSSQFRDGGAGPIASAAAPPAPLDGSVVLSDERTFTRWAYVIEDAEVRRAPDPNSGVLRRLSLKTHHGTPELVVALEQAIVDNVAWVRIRFKIRPNGETGWVRRDQLGAFNLVETLLVIHRKRFRATLFRAGKRIWSARIGVGEARWKTPQGNFYVRERLNPTAKNTIYGAYAFGTSATSPKLSDWPGGGIIGMHGTNQPKLIPGRISHGCIRVRNGRISKLKKLMPLGTPIVIH